MRVFRIITTVVAAPFLAILYLNIEVIAAANGWDVLLLQMAPTMSDLVTQPWLFALSSFFVGVACGVWMHWIASRVLSRGDVNVSQDLEVIANQVFRKNSVRIDGKRFINCDFDDVLIVWDGGPYTFEHCRIEPSRVEGFMTNNPKIAEQMRLYGLLGLLHPRGIKEMGFPLSKADQRMLDAVDNKTKAEGHSPE